MMQVIKYPKEKDWPEILKRPSQDFTSVKEIVQTILNNVKQRGDKALKEYTKRFDKIELDNLFVDQDEWQTAASIDNDLKDAIRLAVKKCTHLS
jgi:histidinol dehydrogenase